MIKKPIKKIRPRGYLSYSSMITLEGSEKSWIKIYLEGHKMSINRGRALGKQLSDALENKELTGDIMTDIVIAKMPKFGLMDKVFKTTILVGKEEIPLLSRIDTAKKTMSAFKEYKSGAEKWNQKKVDKNAQITFYATVLYAITGKIPKDIELVVAPSIKDKETERVELTGEIKIFKTVRTLADILQMKIRMRKAWVRIGELTEGNII